MKHTQHTHADTSPHHQPQRYQSTPPSHQQHKSLQHQPLHQPHHQRRQQPHLHVKLRGEQLLNDPVLNKGTAFTHDERNAFALHGKLPPSVESLDMQVARAHLQYQEQISDVHKNLFLQQLHATNRVLFYRLVAMHLKEMLPVLYTPTVAHAVTNFSHDFLHPHGLYVTYAERDNLVRMLDAYDARVIDMIIVTDGEGVLGIGDQGVGAIHIPIAKLMLYTIFGGVNPARTLPIVLDVGTNNQTLLNDSFYLGWRNQRIDNARYMAFIDHFVTVVKRKFPRVFLHWEDFGRDNAATLLTQYRDKICSFNDDMQGTGVVAVAALTAALKATKQDWREQRIVIFGAGTSGIGIAEQLMVALQAAGLSKEEALRKIWLIDKQGLLTEESATAAEAAHAHANTPAQRVFLRRQEDVVNWQLLRGVNSSAHFISLSDVVKNLHPTILIGCSAQGGAFTEVIIKEMAAYTEHPIIFPLSNPTSKCEATPYDLVRWTGGKALIATGSPFAPVEYRGKSIAITQCNNALAFPGIGCGILAARARKLTDAMLWAACQALAATSPLLLMVQHASDDLLLLPPLALATEVAQKVALAVAMQAQRDGVSEVESKATETMREFILQHLWTPEYQLYMAA